MKHKIIIGIAGASGAIYAKTLLDQLVSIEDQISSVGVLMTENAKDIWKFELGDETYNEYPFPFYKMNDFNAPFASGSAQYNTMIICPCSMGTMGRIASGVSDNLLLRAADVVLKERRKLILVLRETPYSLIHINNMKLLTQAGAIICPASPSFYNRPKDIAELVTTVTDRVIDLADLEIKAKRWGK